MPRLAQSVAILSAILGVLVLLAGYLKVPMGHTTMLPKSALLFVLLGTALWLVTPESTDANSGLRYRIGQGLGVLAGVLGTATLVEHLLGLETAMGLKILKAHVSKETWAMISARPPFPTALNGLALGLGIALLKVRVRGVWLSEVCAVTALLMGLLGFVGRVFGAPELYGAIRSRHIAGMAMHTAAGFLLLAIGLLCARADRGLVAIIRSRTPGGTLARRWMPVPAILLILMGLVYFALRRALGADPAVGTWALFMTVLGVLTAAIWATAAVLHRAGLEQEEAQHTLESRVRERTSELKLANDALITAKEELAHANRDLEQTVQERTANLNETIRSLETVCYNIAHDLRAPNRAIVGFAEVLLAEHSTTLDQEARGCLRRIAAAAQRSDMLTLDLLAYGRLGHTDLPCSSQSLKSHIERAVEKLSQEIKDHQAIVEIIEPLPDVVANPTALEQVITNLLSNALKFVRDGVRPHVRIRAQILDAKCRVFVEDNGIGIPPDQQEKIFGVFHRLHPPDKYPGSGIGLAIVQKSLERMGGRVGVSSSAQNAQNGSCFWFELPRA